MEIWEILQTQRRPYILLYGIVMHTCVACSFTINWIDKVNERGRGDNFQCATTNHDEKWFLCNIVPEWLSVQWKTKFAIPIELFYAYTIDHKSSTIDEFRLHCYLCKDNGP